MSPILNGSINEIVMRHTPPKMVGKTYSRTSDVYVAISLFKAGQNRYSVDHARIELASPACKAGALPLS